MIKSCYIHIPFCNNICSYCDFCKMFYNEKLVSKYLEALDREINNIYKNEVLETIYIGGGTPSCLSFDELEKLLKITKQLNTKEDLEFSFEVNLDSIDKEKLLLLKKYNVNRLSIGIESIDKKNQEIMERYIDKEEVISKIRLIKEMGFSNINLDLMYAFPDEDIDILKKDIDFILSLDVKHVSTYSLIIEEHTKLKIKNIKNIDEDKDFLMYKVICNSLKEAGYVHYEVSNFSKEGYQSKHNLCYWENKEYYGFGLGAASYINNKRIINTRSINKYLDNNYVSEVEELNLEDIMTYQIILNLRLNNGIDKNVFKKKFGKNINTCYNYNRLLEDKLLIENDNMIFIPEDKIYISNAIISSFLEGVVNE